MAENEKDFENQNIRRYKFQTNILKAASDQTTRVKHLDKISSTDEVNIKNIVISMVTGLFVIIALFWYVMSNTVRSGYMWFSIATIFIALIVFVLAFLVPSRNSTMLLTSIEYINFYILERIRRQSKTYGRVKSAGLSDFMNGIIELEDGRVGVAYETEGHLGNSSLPINALRAAEGRGNYFITRENTTEEYMITSIRETDVRSNEREFINIRNAHNSGSAKDNYIKNLAETQYKYTHNSMSKGDYTVSQILIIVEEDLHALEKANNAFIRAVNSNHLYAQVNQITSPLLLSEYISPLLLTSKRGVRKDVEHIQERYQRQQEESGLR